MSIIDRIRTYLRSSQEELKAVTWPTRQDIIRYTGLVVITVVAFGAFFSILDLGLNTGAQAIIASKNAPAQTTTDTTSSTPSVEVNPVDVQATTPSGAPADIKVEQVPLTGTTTKP